MKKNKKLLIEIGIVVITGIALIGVYKNCQKEVDDDVIRIGAILPLTGDFAFEGDKAAKAIMLAEQEINNNEQKTKIKVLLEDGKFTSKDSLLAYNRLMMNGVSAVVSFGTPCTGAIKSRVAKDGVPMMAIDGTAGVPQSSPWIFRCLQTTISVGNAVATALNICGNVRTSALLYMQGDSGDDFAKGFKSVYKGKLVGEEVFAYDSKDSRASIQKLLESNPDSICIFGYGMGYTTALNQLIELEYKGMVITDMNITSILDKLRNGGNGIRYVSLDFGNASRNKKSQEFIKNMKNTYDSEPTSFSAFAYEAINMVMLRLKTDDISRNAIARQILGIKNYDSVVGVISYLPDGEISIPFSLYSIKEGKEQFERKLLMP